MTPDCKTNVGFRGWRAPVDPGQIRRSFLHPLARGAHLLALDGRRALLVKPSGIVRGPTPRYEAVLAIRAGLLAELRVIGRWTLYRISEKGQAIWTCWNAERDGLAKRIRDLEDEVDRLMFEDPAPELVVSDPRCPRLTKSESALVQRLHASCGIVATEELLAGISSNAKRPLTLVSVRVTSIRKKRPDLEIKSHWGIGYELVSGDPMCPPSGMGA